MHGRGTGCIATILTRRERVRRKLYGQRPNETKNGQNENEDIGGEEMFARFGHVSEGPVRGEQAGERRKAGKLDRGKMESPPLTKRDR